jgi:hypothetical protein
MAADSSKDTIRGYHTDAQTGEVYQLKLESTNDFLFAIFSIVYLLGTLAFLTWQLFDVWIGQYTLARQMGYQSLDRLNSPLFRIVAFTFIGGGLGGTISGIRSFLRWHSEYSSFSYRYVWKYINTPWIGATLALIVYAVIGSGLAVLGGETLPQVNNLRQILAMFALGALTGYGSRNVSIWLDRRVDQLFYAPSADLTKVIVPDLTGKSMKEAEAALKEASLAMGKTSEGAGGEGVPAGVVIDQFPPPNTPLIKLSTVDLTVAKTAE